MAADYKNEAVTKLLRVSSQLIARGRAIARGVDITNDLVKMITDTHICESVQTTYNDAVPIVAKGLDPYEAGKAVLSEIALVQKEENSDIFGTYFVKIENGLLEVHGPLKFKVATTGKAQVVAAQATQSKLETMDGNIRVYLNKKGNCIGPEAGKYAYVLAPQEEATAI